MKLKPKEEETPKEIGKIWYPFAAFGSENVPTQKTISLEMLRFGSNTSKEL